MWDFEAVICKVEEDSTDSMHETSKDHTIKNIDTAIDFAKPMEVMLKTTISYEKNTRTNYNVVRKNRGLDQIACVQPSDSMEHFVQEALLDSTFCNTTIIGHGRKFLSVVYKALLKMSVQPITIRKSNGLVRLVSNINNIRFASIDTFLPKDFKTIYEEDEGVVYYPYCANHPDLCSLKNLKTNHFVRYFHKSCHSLVYFLKN